MATVTLRKSGPRRIATRGYTFERTIPVEDVPREIAEQLENDERFTVKYGASDSEAERPETAEADDAPEETGKRVKPKNSTERYAAINEAADQLDLDNEAHFTKDGKPDARALSAILGWVVTSADRDAALKAVAPPAGTPTKVKPNVTIRRRNDALVDTTELVDTGADAEVPETPETDPTTEDPVEV